MVFRGVAMAGFLAWGVQDASVLDVERAIAAGKIEDAVALLEKLPPETGEALLKSLRDRLQVVRELREGFVAGEEAARERVRVARKAVAAEAQEADERDRRIAEAFSKTPPLRVSMPGGVVLEGVRITA
jgi:hypothetical protein